MSVEIEATEMIEAPRAAEAPADDTIADVDLSGFSPELAVLLLIDYAVRIGASDLFFSSNESHVEVSARHLGIIKSLARLRNEMGVRCMTHIKAMAGIKFDERRRPQDGRWVRRYASGRTVDLRLNTMPTLYGDSFAIRVLDRDSLLRPLDALGLVGPQLGLLLSWLQSPSGLILVTGSTGAGKTTTLYSCLQHLNDGRRKIHTIEDPVEYAIEGLRQSQVDEINGPDYQQLMRSVLRQGPDVVMIGEIRDQAAAETAVRAANSGHLVFATTHAPFASGAIQSMLSMGIHPHFLCTSLLGVVGQRLLRTLCPESKVPVDLSHAPRTFEEVQDYLQAGEGQIVYAAGKDDNGNEGFSGRTGVFELLQPSAGIRTLIYDGRSAGEISRCALDEGLIGMRRAALIKVAQGITSFDEILRVVPTGATWEGL
jgi:type II secretory ATPase GspE/PulE/Tfp pilus assembly ATPase PilB-like protein